MKTSSFSKKFRTRLKNKVLLVDDDVFNMLMVSNILNKWNIEFDTAINGKLAIEKLSKTKYDLLLLDLQMPLATGLDVAVFLQRQHSENKYIPIILCTTSYLDDIYLSSLKENLVENYLFKPFDESMLEKAIHEVLHNYPQDE